MEVLLILLNVVRHGVLKRDGPEQKSELKFLARCSLLSFVMGIWEHQKLVELKITLRNSSSQTRISICV